MSTEGEMAPRRRRTSLPVGDDMLREILLRLPPRPSSLPRASLVCKRWRRLVADPRFQRRFRDHHGKQPPLLGFFIDDDNRSCPFVPTLGRPDRVPGARFSAPLHSGNRIVDCRHGLVLFLRPSPPRSLLVWDPVARKQRRLILPPELDNDQMLISNGAVLRPARGQGRRSSQFQVALITYGRGRKGVSVWLYSSETGIWSSNNSLELQSPIHLDQSSTLIGNSLSWLVMVKVMVHYKCFILEFDLDRQCIALTELPPHIQDGYYYKLRIMPTEDGGLGFMYLSQFHAQLWKRMPDSDGLAVWALDRAIEFEKLLGSTCKGDYLTLVGFAEECNAVLVRKPSAVFVVYLQSMEFKKLSDRMAIYRHYPFACCYAAGTGVLDGHDGDEVLNNM